MNTYITMNYVILAVLFTFLITEAMSSLSIMYDRKSLPSVKKYFDPVWGVIGTFAVFFVVNTEVLYPSVFPSIDSMYVFPILLATFLFIARNVFLVFSEYVWKDSKISQLLLARTYSIASFAILLVLIIIFLSLITGLGTNSALTSFSISAFVSNYYSLGFIVGLLLIVFGLAFPFFRLEKFKGLSPLMTVIGLALFIISMSALGMIVNYVTYIIAVAIAFTSLLYFLTGKSRREPIFVLIFLSVLSINILNYGRIFGTRSLYSFLNNSAVSSASLAVTIVGGLLLTAMLIFFLYMYKRPDAGMDYSNRYTDSSFEETKIANLYIMPNSNKENGKEHKKGKNKQR
jgi:cytochrome d ubiquinol oxidase subunit II